MPKPRILIQAGHVAPREPGFESGTGTTREIEFAFIVRTKLAGLLAKDGRWDVTLCPGDIPDGWTGALFLSLHGDGSANTAASGYCYGYPEGSPQSQQFAKRLEIEYERLVGHPPKHADNYTGALRYYYGWRRVNCPIKVLVEHGFLTNPAERAWLFARAPQISEAHYRALCKQFGRRPVALQARPGPKPKPNVKVDVAVDGRTVNIGQSVGNPKLWERVRRFAGRAKVVVIRRAER